MRLLGTESAETFLPTYWQQQPLFLPGAVDETALITGDELAGLSLEEELESRMIFTAGREYSVQHGPFEEALFTTLPEAGWTLLVQSVDLFLPTVAKLKTAVDFLPSWRVDDVMVSYATPGGGVGPHFDFYDVFLVQLEGEREWRIGQRCDENTPVDTSSGLKLLEHFEEGARYAATPGDVLYIPPGFAHWGTAASECLTASVGFRAPTRGEMLADLATELMAIGDARFYRDPPLRPDGSDVMRSEHIAQLQAMLSDLASDEALLGEWFARYMTQSRYPFLLEDTEERRTASFAGRRYLNGSPIEDD